jgi:hypothetical protein
VAGAYRPEEVGARITTTPTLALSPFASSRTKGGAGYVLSTVAKVRDAAVPNIVIPAQAGIQCLSMNAAGSPLARPILDIGQALDRRASGEQMRGNAR